MIYFDIKILVIVLAVLALAPLLVRNRNKTILPLILALVIATIWTVYFRYEYNENNLFLFNRINIYPLTLWTVGLTGLHLISYELPKRYRIALAMVFYLVFLVVAEVIGYHLLNIRLNSNYTSLLNLGVIHAPTTMKIFYIFAGPVYILLINWLYRTKTKPFTPLGSQ